MSADPWLIETYFDWLREEAFQSRVNRREYEGVLRVLHDIPFYWTIWSDENRAGDAMAFRQHEFLNVQDGLETLDQIWLGQWAMATPSVLEVLIGIARRWAIYFGGEVPYYFGHMFRNMSFDHVHGRSLPGQVQEQVRAVTDDWMARQFQRDGQGSPFPVNNLRQFGISDMRKIDIWGQMNAYSAEHFQ